MSFLQNTTGKTANLRYNILVAAVRDSYGNTFTAVLNDSSDTFSVYDLLDKSGAKIPAFTTDAQQFCSERFSDLGLSTSYARKNVLFELEFEQQ